jgi:hypothetical protein
MPDLKAAYSDNAFWTKLLFGMNTCFLFVIVLTSSVFLKSQLADLVFWSFLGELIVVNLGAALWIRKQNRKLFRNHVLIIIGCIPVGYLLKISLRSFFVDQ